MMVAYMIAFFYHLISDVAPMPFFQVIVSGKRLLTLWANFIINTVLIGVFICMIVK